MHYMHVRLYVPRHQRDQPTGSATTYIHLLLSQLLVLHVQFTIQLASLPLYSMVITCLDKYKLIHFCRTKKKFNISTEVRLEGQSVGLKTDIRILSVRLDSALRQQAHMRAVEAKVVHIVNTLRIITGSIQSCSLEAGKQVYETVVRSAITYAVSVQHASEGVKGY